MSEFSQTVAEPPHAGPSDHAIEQFVGRLLQIGVLLSAIIIAAGGIMLLMHHGSEVPVYTPFRGEPPALATLHGILRGAFSLDARATIQFGLLLLIATPVMRVGFTLVAFALQRDRKYVLITAIVLTLLLYGLLFGRA
ncbi:MAG TPA: DUF1634 domain-containing protein [Gemmatimonadaceae bacterium]|nr:DUF1634 domain-containing protein [Gemmatimonadaceae bacterium]